jgi:TolA-binding protein
MTFQLEKAEKNMRRTTKAASTYRDELSRVNSKSILKDQALTTIANEKDSKIHELERQLEQMKKEIEEKEKQQRLLQLAAEEKKNKSKVCIIS